MRLTVKAKARLELAQKNGLFLGHTENSVVELIENQRIASAYNFKAECTFGLDDLDAELKDLI